MLRKISPISKNIQRLRKQKGLLQDRLSKLANDTYDTIIKIEAGSDKNPTIETLAKIAKALSVGVDDLIK